MAALKTLAGDQIFKYFTKKIILWLRNLILGGCLNKEMALICWKTGNFHADESLLFVVILKMKFCPSDDEILATSGCEGTNWVCATE